MRVLVRMNIEDDINSCVAEQFKKSISKKIKET